MSAQPAPAPAPRVALVTGASRGIGRAIALALARRGWDVIANWVRSADAAASLEREVAAGGGRCRSVRANVGRAPGREALIRAAREEGRLDALIHNAALGSFKPLLQTRPNQWDMTMAINSHALLELSRGLADLLAESRGSILSLSSQGGQRVIPNYGAIGISKAALESLTRYLAVELGPRGVRVNTVCAGWVDTDAVTNFPDHAEMRRAIAGRTPLGRVAEPRDIADVVMLLLSDEARWITGQRVVADGGAGIL